MVETPQNVQMKINKTKRSVTNPVHSCKFMDVISSNKIYVADEQNESIDNVSCAHPSIEKIL